MLDGALENLHGAKPEDAAKSKPEKETVMTHKWLDVKVGMRPCTINLQDSGGTVSYTHLRAHETEADL
eukprot:3721460-Amphidinium_carterae.1